MPFNKRRFPAGEKLDYALAATSLGNILVAASDRGIRAVLIERAAERLIDALQAACPGADIAASPHLQHLADKVAKHIEDPRSALDVELDLRGNDFQMKVWAALRAIPVGTTVSYGELAARTGAAGSARAVGTACAANIIAVIIPCHRVVRSDGGLSGYRWGVENKRFLLERESAPFNRKSA